MFNYDSDDAPSAVDPLGVVNDGELIDQLMASLTNQSTPPSEGSRAGWPQRGSDASPFDRILSNDETEVGVIIPTAPSRPANIIAAAEHAIDREIGLIVLGKAREHAQWAASILAEPYRSRETDGLALYGSHQPLTTPTDAIPVVANACDSEWVLTSDGELEYRVDGSVRIAGPVEAPVSAFDIHTPLLTREADGYVLRDATGTLQERFDDRRSALADRHIVPVPAVPSQPEYLSVLPSVHHWYVSGRSVASVEDTAPWASQGVDDRLPETSHALQTFMDRYTTTGDELPVAAVIDRFRAWFEAHTDRPAPRRHVLGRCLPDYQRRATDDGVKRFLPDCQWIIEPGQRSPLFPATLERSGGEEAC